MKKNKKLLNELFSLTLIFLLFYFDLFSLIPDLEIYILTFILAVMSIAIFTDFFELKKRNSDPFFYLRTNNDQYSTIIRFIFGGIIISGTIICSLITDLNPYILLLVFILGLFTFARGFFPVKTTRIKIDKPEIIIEHLDKKHFLNMNSIHGVEITENEIVFKLAQNRRHTIGFLALPESDLNRVKIFLQLPLLK